MTYSEVGEQARLEPARPSLLSRVMRRFLRYQSGRVFHPAISIADRRRRLEGLARLVPMSNGVRREAACGGPCAGVWFRPYAVRGPGIVIHFHGGAYAYGSPVSHREFLMRLARTVGRPVLAPDYRLAPECPFPAGVEDAAGVIQWAMAQSSGPVALCGDSSGGGQVVAALLRLREEGVPLPRAAALLSPWVDLTLSGESHRTARATDALARWEGLADAVADYLGDADPRHPWASPIFADLRGLPPLLVQVGTHELLRDDARGLAARARECDVDVMLEEWAGMYHSWQMAALLVPEGRAAIASVARFLDAHLQE